MKKLQLFFWFTFALFFVIGGFLTIIFLRKMPENENQLLLDLLFWNVFWLGCLGLLSWHRISD